MVKFLAVYFLDKTKIIFSQPFFSYSLVTSLKWLHLPTLRTTNVKLSLGLRLRSRQVVVRVKVIVSKCNNKRKLMQRVSTLLCACLRVHAFHCTCASVGGGGRHTKADIFKLKHSLIMQC